MSKGLTIEFAANMPEALVEVVAPNLEILHRIWLAPGERKCVDVQSSESFLRVHIHSGRVVTLHAPGKLNRQVHLIDVQKKFRSDDSFPTQMSFNGSEERINDFGNVRGAPMERHTSGAGNFRPEEFDALASTTSEVAAVPVSIPDGVIAQLTSANKPFSPVNQYRDGAVRFANVRDMTPCKLTVTDRSGGLLVVQLPGVLREVCIRSKGLHGDVPYVTIEVATYSMAADSLLAFMTKGDYYSATGMSMKAERLLYKHAADPFAAMIGAYLLLKTRRLDRLRNRAQCLAMDWPGLTDGKIIWAWQLIYERNPHAETAIRQLLRTAANGEFPVFTQGLDLLRDGLRLLGASGQRLLRKFNQRVGMLLPNSPFTAQLQYLSTKNGSKETRGPRIQLRVGFAEPHQQVAFNLEVKTDDRIDTDSFATMNSAHASVTEGGVVKRKSNTVFHWGTGRRKTAVARVRICGGTGEVLVNGRSIDHYFTGDNEKRAVFEPLDLLESRHSTDVYVRVTGGGLTGQSGAIRQGLARALKVMHSLAAESDVSPTVSHSSLMQKLRDSGFLTRDGRMKERKKYGRKGARRGFQFSKR